ncbi:MAG: ABC transporter ATP-binding protein [Candidatus Bathyarchaeota archaeon]|nr:ABC transporter ATP-binding protein [Candidatus Bathyarchaeota archaeon]MDH5495457.1 ABC transporter ATP-binding protein [Candidatus Bathyarchaeota archaeon]
MPKIQLKGVTKRFGKKILAVDNVSLEVHDKEYFSLIGPSGCGKTTLLRAIAGLIHPTKGKIYIDDALVNNVPPEDRGIGFVFQTYALFPHMNVFDNVTYGPRVKAWEEKKAASLGRETLEMVKLEKRFDAYPHELSGGMMQRVAVARALAAGSKILLLDEPLGALDAKIRNELRYEIRRLVKDLGLTAIHVTHDQAEAMAISDRIAVMKKGRILQVGTPYELYMKPQQIFVANFIGESNFLEGRVTGVKGDVATVRLRGDLKVSAKKNKAAQMDKRVVLAVRPEAFEIAKGRKNLVNGLNGVIEKVRFEGTDIRYEIRLANDDSIIVVRPSLGGEWLKEADEVTVGFSPEKSHMFLYPPKGLMAELEVE